METGLSLSVFFPCYNEEGALADLVRRTLAVLADVSEDYELIIVDDGSTDRTGEIADQLAAENEAVRVIHHGTNKGYGAALQSGFRAARKEWVFYTDGDGQFDIGELKDILPLREQYDIVSCYRLRRQEGWRRRLNAWAWNKLVNRLFGLRLKDIDCAFKLYRRDLFDRIEMHSQGALIDTEVLARAQRLGYRITQYGVKHLPRRAGQSTGANLGVILRAFKELFELRKKILQGD